MSEQCTLEEVEAFATRLGPWAHLATVGADGEPDVVPVHPCWEGETPWSRVGTDSVKDGNAAANPNDALHWQVTEVGDGVFDDDLDQFAPGGAENSPSTAFLAVSPRRALVVEQYGMGGMLRWNA